MMDTQGVRSVLRATVLALLFAGWDLAPGASAVDAGVITEVLVVDPPAVTVPQGGTRGFAAFRGPSDANGDPDLGPDARPGTADDQFQLAAVSWSVAGGIGMVSPLTGATTIFIATTPGSGQVVGVLGGLQAAANVFVLAVPPTNTRTPTPTTTATLTATPSTTATATDTAPPTTTATATRTDTATTAPTDTHTATYTATRTDTPLPPATATDTATPTDTHTTTQTATRTDSPLPAATATDTATPTDTPTLTVAPTDTHTATHTATATDTPIPAPPGTATATATPTATWTATRVGTATHTPAASPPAQPATHTATFTATASMGIDLAITKEDEGPFRVGISAAYRIRVTNVGDTPTAGEITVTDTLPPEIEYVSPQGAGWTCPTAPAGPAIVCTHPGPLGPRQSLELVLNVRVRLDAPAGTLVFNEARVATPGDTNPANDATRIVHGIGGSPDLAIEKTAAGPFVENSAGLYLIKVTNVGRIPYKGPAKVVDMLPAGLRFLSAPSDRFACSSADGVVVECVSRFLTLNSGESAHIDMLVAVLLDPGVPVMNAARVEPDSSDPNPANDGPVSVTVEVVEEPVGELPPCGVNDFAGSFEPSQGVWQDDYTFLDQPGKQLTQISPRLYIAELPMVRERHSLLFGLRGTEDSRRDKILFSGTGSGSTIGVRVRFTLEQGLDSKLLYVSERFPAPLGEPCGQSRPFQIEIDASHGIPPSGTMPFTFDRTGPYRIVAELIREDGSGTDLRVFVIGNVEDTGRLVVHFVPGTFVPLAPDEKQALRDSSDALADLSERRLPDGMPLAPRAVTAPSHAVQDLTAFIARVDADPEIQRRGIARRKAIRSEISRLMQGGNLLAGAKRVAVVLAPEDYVLVEPERSGGFADSMKVFYVPAPRSPSDQDYTAEVVQHEIVHTMPFLWSGNEMLRDCQLDYHNKDLPVAHGHRILRDGLIRRQRQRNATDVMGPSFPIWTGQCTYWHTLQQLLALPDPALHLVQGRVIRDPGDPFGELFPLYDVLGDDFAQPGEGGDWAIVLRDAGGASLGRFPFDPVFTVPDVADAERRLATFAFHVPRFAETARVELVGPGDTLLDATDLTPSPPDLAITAPLDGEILTLTDGSVAVRWTASDPDGDEPLPATVLYSDDAGETWQVAAFEQSGTSLDLSPSLRRHGHLLRVLVSDGSRSVEQTLGFVLDLEERADLAVTQSAPPDPAVRGGEIEYTLEARNHGPTDASAVVLTDTLPAGTTFVTASPDCGHDGGVVTCALGDLRAGGARQRTIIVRVDATAALTLENEVSIAAAEPDPDPANDRATLVTALAGFGACPPSGVSPTARVEKGAIVRPNAIVCDGAVVKRGARVGAAAIVGENARVDGDARVKAGARLERGARLGEDSRLGKESLLGAGGRIDKDVRIGGASVLDADVRLEKDVRVGARARIAPGVRLAKEVRAGTDLAIGDDTSVERGARLGNRVTLGRNVRVGRDARIGDDSRIGDEVTIADHAVVPPGSVIP
jgi:uncharacterized repeat protein (TIGR01451 family)